jgi:hypothetical protein
MQLLCTLAMTADSADGLPTQLDLATLEPFSLTPGVRERILGCFAGGRLLSYQRLPDGGYELLARADESEHTLIRGRNGAATIISDGDASATAGADSGALLSEARQQASL